MITRFNSALMRIVAVCIGVLIIFSCSSEKDMRKGVVESLGEPDFKETGGSGAYKYENYVYLNKDIDRVYIFYKSAPGCGSSGNWYVEYVYTASYYGYEVYQAPIIKHDRIESAPLGQQISISAEITDDVQVIDADLYYRVIGAEEYTILSMAVSESTYSAEIPVEAVTSAGVEYYIQATDDEDHKSKYPLSDTFKIKVTGSTVKKTSTGESKSIQRQLPDIVPEHPGVSSSPLSD